MPYSARVHLRCAGLGRIESKLPDVGTTIFTVMSALAEEHEAINLSQGYPDFDAPADLLERVYYHLTHGANQYPPMMGTPELRRAIAAKANDCYGAAVDPDREITVTAGATEGLFCAIAALVKAGDEVVVFDPAYDSYEPAVRLQGARTVHVPLLRPEFKPDWGRVADAVSPRTRLIVINTPHNPTGTVWNDEDIRQLQNIVASGDIYLLADEVYEHMVFDNATHVSLLRYDELYARSFVVSSFGKTYHATGWKVGYCIAPPDLTTEFRRIHQYVNFTVNTPMQRGIADFLVAHPEHHRDLPAFYQRKRDLFCGLLEQSKFHFKPSAGTYFQLLDCTDVDEALDTDLARRWTVEHKLASVPVSVFYASPEDAPRSMLRFCFAKHDDTLKSAAEILCSL